MWKNYLKIVYRTLRRQKGYAFINVFGLALGVACCVLLFLYVRHELSYDRFHEKADRLFRVVRVTTTPGGERSLTAFSAAPLAPALEASFPEVEETARLTSGSANIQHEGTLFEENVLYTDSSFFAVFSFPLLKGNPQTTLTGPNSLVLTERTARKYFGDKNPLGQSLTIKINEETLDLRVTGVVQNPPSNSSIQFDLLRPFSASTYGYPPGIRNVILTQWDLLTSSTFLLLHDTGQAPALEAKLTAFSKRARKADAGEKEFFTFSPEELSQLRLQPLADIHLSPDIEPAALEAPGNPLYAYLLSGVALLVLLIACINFTTLALGRSASRAKEVGVRKVVGAHRGQIRRQFWGEALLTSSAALVVGLLLARGFLPVFNELAGKELSLHLTPETLLFLLGLVLVISFLAGSYPALVLSRFEPARILRGRTVLGGSSRLTRALVVVQFTLSIALVVGALVISAQLRFAQTNLGFNQERVVRIETAEEIYEPFRQEALRYPGVESIAGATFSFFGGGLSYPLVQGDTGRVEALVFPVTDTFLETLGIEVVAGRGFSKERTSGGALVNRAFVRAMGWRSSALGKVLPSSAGQARLIAIDSARVIGVVADFHTRSMHQRIEPAVFLPSADVGVADDIYARLAPGEISEGLAALRATWQTVAPDRPFQYELLDEVVEEAYRAEQRWRAIIRYAAGFALLIACFGLFGLAALAAGHRTKEIGIRKVLGASATSITLLLSKDFLKLVLVAFVIAAPVAYLGARQWLQDFAYHIELEPGLFLLAGGLVCAVALGAVSYQAIRAALADPVDALRYE